MADCIKKTDHLLTYADDGRWELINGVANNMSAESRSYHQTLAAYLIVELGNFLKSKLGKLFPAPFEVVLPDFPGQETSAASTVVQT